MSIFKPDRFCFAIHKIKTQSKSICLFVKAILTSIAATYLLTAHKYNKHWNISTFFQTEDLSSLEKTHCIYEAGRDRQGRPVIAFIGKWFPYETIDLVR